MKKVIGIHFLIAIYLVGTVASAAEKLKVRVFKDLEVSNPLTQKMIRKELESTDRILFVRKENQKTDVIAELQFQNYLERVLLAEIPMSWSDEAIKAQIIATKSYTLARIRESGDRSFHLEGSVEDQAFVKKLNRFSATQIQRLRRLIRETRYTFLTDGQGGIVKAFYHADCGGQTIEAPHIWNEAKSFGVTKDPFCASRKTSKWSYALNRDEFWQRIKELKPKEVSAIPSIFDSIVLRRFSLQKRVREVQFLAVNTDLSFSGEEIRRALGFGKVKSTQFQLSADEGIYRFSGQGAGHGVGLCQRGAAWMATHGFTSNQILAHYYPKAKLTEVMK